MTCSIIGLSRKVTTLVASIYIYGHALNAVQATGLVIAVGAMVMNFWGKKGSNKGHGHGHGESETNTLPTVSLHTRILKTKTKRNYASFVINTFLLLYE